MDPLSIAQAYFDAWNARDAAGVLATFSTTGTYSDPSAGQGLRGEALAGYLNGLWSAFPDLTFEIVSAAATGPDSAAAQWIMRGTNTGSMMGLPPTGKQVTLPGADFIRTRGGQIESVEGYFDSGAVPRQLGLQVIAQPNAIGPFSFGTSVRVSAGSGAKPGAYSITALRTRSVEDIQRISDHSRQIASEMLGMPGFIALAMAVVGDRMLTIAAWEDAHAPQQLLQAGRHTEAMRDFYGAGLAAGGVTSVWIPDRIGPRWQRCAACGKMTHGDKSEGVCACGTELGEPLAYW